jgi:hypothetical protein
VSRTFATGVVFAAFVSLLAVPALAHHTVAYTFDVKKIVSLTGTVTSIDWKYPHVIYRLSVPDTNGREIDWEIESRHPQGMHREGIEPETVKAGDHVTMNVMLAIDGSHHAGTAPIVLAGGRVLPVCTVTNNACPSS